MNQKIYQTISLLTLALLWSVVIGACKDESRTPVDDNRDPARLQVLAAETHFDIEGGVGAIQLNQEGFTYSIAGAPWCVVSPAGDKGLKVEVDGNPLPQSRSTLVVVTKGNETLNIPVIQLGSSDDASIPIEVTFESQGGSESFRIEFDSKPTFTLTDGGETWLTVEVVGESLLLTAAPHYLTTQRITTLEISAGIYHHKLRVIQKGAPLPEIPAEPASIENIDDILGDYIFKFKLTDEKVYEQPVKLVKGTKTDELILKGLAVDFKLTVENNNLKLTSAQTMPKDLYLFYASGLGENQCLELDILGQGKAVFLAPAMKRGDAYSFTFTSNSKENCEVMVESQGTGVFKNPRGFLIFDSKNQGFYFGPNEETGVFFDFSMTQKS